MKLKKCLKSIAFKMQPGGDEENLVDSTGDEGGNNSGEGN